jgi:hypothetical protein
MTLARTSGVLFLASIVWMFSSSDGPRPYADLASIVAALLCLAVLAFLHRTKIISGLQAGLAIAAAVWFVLGILYLRYLSPPSDIGGAGLALLGMIAMVVVAMWMTVDVRLTATEHADHHE